MLVSDRKTLQTVPSVWGDFIRSFEFILRARGLSERTISTRILHLRQLAREIGAADPRDVTEPTLLLWSGGHEWMPETRNAYHSSVRTFFRWLSRTEGIPDPAVELRAIHRPTPPAHPTPDRIIAETIASADERTALILTLAAELGLRCAEIARLRTDDLTPDDAGWWLLLVHGKGRKERVLPVPPRLACRIFHAADESQWVFPSPYGGHLTEAHVSRLGTRSLPGKWTLHSLRHRFATTAYNRGGHDIIAVQKALGHEDLKTTERYTATTTDLHRIIETTCLGDEK